MAISEWPLLLRQSLLRRTPAEEFERLARLMRDTSPVSSSSLAKQLLDCRYHFCVPGDPLVAAYIRISLDAELLTPSALLVVILQRWNRTNGLASGDGTISTPAEDAVIISMLADVIKSHQISESVRETRRLIVLTSRWLTVLSRRMSPDSSPLHLSEILVLMEAAGLLLATVLNTDSAKTELARQSDLTGSSSTGNHESSTKFTLRKALDMCQIVLASTSPHLYHCLYQLQKQFDLLKPTTAIGDKTISDRTIQSDVLGFESSIVDEVVPSLVAMHIYIDAMLRNHATIDDSRLLTYLNARHPNNHESMFIELTMSSFSVLSAWTARSESKSALMKCQRFLVNKVPMMLLLIAESSFGAFSSEITLANLMHGMEVGSGEQNLETRQRFFNVCHSNHLVSADALLSAGLAAPLELEAYSVYRKENIVDKLSAGIHQALPVYISELTRLDGNSSAISQALAETIQRLCIAKETSALKEIANAILHKPEVIDIIACFILPATLLRPLCALLDDWSWDDLHGESQPVYDEFGSVLLLIEAFRFKLDLGNSEIGIRGSSEFMATLLEQGNTEQRLHHLTDEMKRHLSEWINALFIAEGLSDDLTSSCSPHHFYLLVPTLLHQSMLAQESGKMNWETLRSGFEYLLEPFLLPSLMPGILWLSCHAPLSHSYQLIGQVMQVLIKLPESSDARKTHQIIWRMAAPYIQHAMSNKAADTPEIRSILATIDDLETFAHPISRSDHGTRQWTAEEGGLKGVIARTIENLVISSNENTLSSFTYALFNTAIDTFGAKSVLDCLLHELLSFPQQLCRKALDIVAAIICSSISLSLRDALRFQHRQLSSILGKDEVRLAEAVVRLYHRVENQNAVPLQQAQSDPNIEELNIDEMVSANPNLDIAPLTAAQEQAPDIDAVLEAAAAMGQGDAGDNLDDVFGVPDDDMGMFDDLDMDNMF